MVAYRDSSHECRVCPVPYLSEDHSLKQKPWIWHLTAFHLLHCRKTDIRISIETVTLFRLFELSNPSHLFGCVKLLCSILVQPGGCSNLSLGWFPILVASELLWYLQHLFSDAVLGAEDVFLPLFLGKHGNRRMKHLAEGYGGKADVCQHTQNHNHKTFHFTLITLARNKLKHTGLARNFNRDFITHITAFLSKCGKKCVQALQGLWSRTFEFLKCLDLFLLSFLAGKIHSSLIQERPFLCYS